MTQPETEREDPEDKARLNKRISEYLPLAERLAKRIAWVPADEPDLVQVGCIALFKALTKTPTPDRPWSFARTVLSRHMQNYYSYRERNNPPPASVEVLRDERRLPSTRLVRDPPPQESPLDHIERMEQEELLEDFLDALDNAGGPYRPYMRLVAENMLNPGASAIIREYMGEDVPQRVTDSDIRRALGLSVPKWFAIKHEIQRVARDWWETYEIYFPERTRRKEDQPAEQEPVTHDRRKTDGVRLVKEPEHNRRKTDKAEQGPVAHNRRKTDKVQLVEKPKHNRRYSD